MKNTFCKHFDRKHYAKVKKMKILNSNEFNNFNQNMCNNCYHNKGRFRMAYKCEHTDRKLYALGICATCYHYKYSKIRVKRKKLFIKKDQDS